MKKNQRIAQVRRLLAIYVRVCRRDPKLKKLDQLASCKTLGIRSLSLAALCAAQSAPRKTRMKETGYIIIKIDDRKFSRCAAAAARPAAARVLASPPCARGTGTARR